MFCDYINIPACVISSFDVYTKRQPLKIETNIVYIICDVEIVNKCQACEGIGAFVHDSACLINSRGLVMLVRSGLRLKLELRI